MKFYITRQCLRQNENQMKHPFKNLMPLHVCLFENEITTIREVSVNLPHVEAISLPENNITESKQVLEFITHDSQQNFKRCCIFLEE
jgi:predicted transposase YdaD